MAKDQKKKLTGKPHHGGAGRLGGKIRGLLTEESLYGTRQIPLPTPKCVVFYNGEADVP